MMLVVAGLDPATHLFKKRDTRAFAAPKGLRPRRRVEPAHDEREMSLREF